jgi:L1 cell adhesion molecule like protein
MITILEELHKYVPQVEHTVTVTAERYTKTKSVTMVYPILLGGDQLSTARARSAKAAKRTETPCADRLDGLVPVFEDWHARVTLLAVRLYT